MKYPQQHLSWQQNNDAARANQAQESSASSGVVYIQNLQLPPLHFSDQGNERPRTYLKRIVH